MGHVVLEPAELRFKRRIRLTWRKGAAALKADLANMVMIEVMMETIQLVPREWFDVQADCQVESEALFIQPAGNRKPSSSGTRRIEWRWLRHTRDVEFCGELRVHPIPGLK